MAAVTATPTARQIPFQLGDMRRNSLGARRRDIFGLLVEGGRDPIHLLEARKQVACYFLHHNDDETPRTKSRDKVIELICANPSLAFDKYTSSRVRVDIRLSFYSPLTMLIWEQCVDRQQLDKIFRITNDRNHQRRYLDRRFSIWRSTQELLVTTLLHAPAEPPLLDETMLYVISKVEEGSTISIYSGVEKALLKRKHDVGSHLSWQVIQALIERSLSFSKAYVAGRRLLGYLHLLGYDDAILKQVIRHYPQMCETIKLYWHEPEHKPQSYLNEAIAQKLERLLQQGAPHATKRIDSDRHNWDLKGWNRFVTSLTKCTSLQSLRLCLPTGWLANHQQDGYAALKYFFQWLPPKLEHFSLGCGGPESELHSANDACLYHVLRGLEANQHKEGPICKRLHLFGFDTLPCQILDELGQFVGSLEFGANTDVPDRPVIIGGMSGPTIGDPLAAIGPTTACSDHRGLSIWRTLAQIPNHRTWGTIKTRYSFTTSRGIPRAGPEGRLQKAPRLNESHLSHLHIDTGGYQPNPRTTDITNAMVAMLQLASLKELAIAARSISFGPISEATCFLGLEVAPVLQALKENSSLKRLVLHGLSFACQDDNTIHDVPALLLKTLENNTSLQELSAFENKAVLTIFQGRPFHGYHFYADHATSLQIQYKCWLNKFGVEKLRDPSITTAEFVQLLLKAKASRHAARSGLSECLGAVARYSPKAATSLRKFNKMYLTLRHHRAGSFYRHQPLHWCYAKTGLYQAETLSILYGVLREAPSVWSSNKVEH